MDYRVIAWALAVLLLAVCGAFWAVLEQRDTSAIQILREDYSFIRDQHLKLRDRIRALEQEVAEIQGEDDAEDLRRLSSPPD